MKRKREEDKPVSDPPLIKVEYANLPTESRHKLDSLLHEWKSWHTDRFPEGFRPPEVLSGTLHYEPNGVLSTLPKSALPVLDDRPAPPVNPITRTMWFNVQYERTGEVPTYERAVDRPLKMPSAALAATKMKQLPNVTSRDALASPEASTKETTNTNTGVIAVPGVSGSDKVLITPISFGGGFKKQRTSQRCFNCGSYAHSLRECWKEYNPEAIEEARRRMQGVTGGGPPKRYFSVEEQKISKEKHKKKERLKNKNSDADGNEGNNDTKSNNSSSEEEDGELEESLDEEDLTVFEKLQREFPLTSPGILSSSLREGLGIGALDPPPWIHAMRAMGVPPAYQQRIKETHEEALEQEKEDLPPPPPPLEHEKEEKEETSEDALLSMDDDKGNIGATAVALALAGVQEDLNEDAEDFIRLPMKEDNGDEEGDSEGSDDENKGFREEVKFPGVNAPIPEGADPLQWGTGDIGGGYVSIQQQQLPAAAYWPSAPSPQPPPPPPPQPGQQNPQNPADVAYYGQQQHGYHQQEWNQHYHHHHHQQYPQQGYYSTSAAAAPYYNQSDYYGHQQQQAPPAPGGYYQPPPPPPSSVLPYQPPPPATELIDQAEQPPPPPPPSDAEHET